MFNAYGFCVHCIMCGIRVSKGVYYIDLVMCGYDLVSHVFPPTHHKCEVDTTFIFPDPSAAAEGFEPRGRKVVRATQDRYGHAAVVNTPEREKQRKNRFSAQPLNRNKRPK